MRWSGMLMLALAAAAVALPAAAGAPPVAAPRYDMTVRLLPQDHRIEVRGTLRVPPADVPRETLVLSVNRAFDQVVFSLPGETGALRVGKAGGYTDYALRPARPFPAHREIVVGFAYRSDGSVPASYLALDASGAFASGVNVAWYPQLQAPAWTPRGVGTLRFELPAGWSALASGREAEAGSSTFAVDTPTAFAFAAGPYTVVRAATGAVPVSVYLLDPARDGAHYAAAASRVLDALATTFGPYPFVRFAIVEVPEAAATRSGFSGQSEAGMIWVTPRFLTPSFNTAYYGHEIGHQWWGQLVEKDYASTSGFYMPDEAMAQYGSLEAVRRIEGEAAAERYRRTGYPNYVALQNGVGYLSLLAAGVDEAIDGPRQPTSHLLANSKGMLGLSALADLLGRERFNATLRDFLQAHAHQQVSWPQLKSALQAATPLDLAGFLQQWFARSGAPDWQLQWRQEGGVLALDVAQAPPAYALSVAAEAVGACGRMRWTIALAGERTRATRAFACRAEAVTLDPEFRVLHWTPEYRALAAAQVPYAHWTLRDADPELDAEMAAALQAVAQPDVAGAAFAIQYQWGRACAFDKRWADARRHYEAALAQPVRRADDLPWVHVRLAWAARELGDTAAMQAAANAALAAEARLATPTGAAAEARALLR